MYMSSASTFAAVLVTYELVQIPPVEDGAAPSVELALSTSPTAAAAERAAAPRKPTIGLKKAPPKKAGLGAKKGGLGAQRVSKDFAEIEKEAELADQIALTRTEAAKVR